MKKVRFYAAIEPATDEIVSNIETSIDAVLCTSKTAVVCEIHEFEADAAFRKEMLASEKKRNNTRTRILYGHLTDEDLWYGASTGLEALNPITGNWVTIWDINQ